MIRKHLNNIHSFVGNFRYTIYMQYPPSKITFSIIFSSQHERRHRAQVIPSPEHVDKVFDGTHMMSIHKRLLVYPNKWCDNNVETRDVHGALKPHHDSQRRTQIVKSESKVAWVRVKRMPSDKTRNHSWCIAHQIVLCAQPADKCKCGKRMTVDHVHFEC